MIIGNGDVCAGANGSAANGKARATATDEVSTLWQTHRLLNEEASRRLKPHGVMFRIEITELTAEEAPT